MKTTMTTQNNEAITGEKRFKAGKLTLKEKAFIKQNSGNLTIAQMSKKLERTASIIEAYLEESGSEGLFTSEVLDILRKSHEYELLKSELTEKEIKIFEKKYSEWVGQFKEDIIPSERSQIFNAIKMDMMMSKLMQRNKVIEENMAEIEEDIRAIRDNEHMDADTRQKRITELRQYRQDSYGHYNANIRVYQEQTVIYMKMLVDLKASRAQRKTNDEELKNTFLGLLRNMKDDNQRTKIGEDCELEKLAAEAEEKRYSSTTSYLDGTVDTPFVTGKTE